MRNRAALLLVAIAAAVGGCSYSPPYEVIEREGRVLFTTEREWRWFLVPYRPSYPVNRIDLWAGDRWLWRIAAPPRGQLMLPIRYGEVPEGALQLVAPTPLRQGETYHVDFEGWRTNFRVGGHGQIITDRSTYAKNPEELAEQRRIDRRIADLVATGMSEAAARRAFAEEQRLGVRY